ncbi:EGF-domain O-GlcNAc transferase isoform X1 [Rhodnius prolixus]
MAFKEKVITLFLFIIFFGETSNNLYDVNLPEEHLPFYLSSFPSVAEQCDKDPDCVLKKFLGQKKCWGYEVDCKQNNSYSIPECPGDHRGWVKSKKEQINVFYNQGDFGYIKERLDEMAIMCEPTFMDDTSLECANHLRFCRGRNVFMNFTSLLNRKELLRYKMDVFSKGDIGGRCRLHTERLMEQCDQISPLQSWGPEMRFFTEIREPVKSKCDIEIEKPTFILKIDATVNMYHHFCDFFNLYASQHLNSSHPDTFSTDVHILIWESYRYYSNFGETWEAFTRHPLWDLNTFKGKTVCFKNVVFPLLPRMIFGLYYNTPIVWGCEKSGLFRSFSQHVLHRLKIPVHKPKDSRIRVTLLSRDTSYRNILNEGKLIAALKNNSMYNVQRVVYNKYLTFKEQLEITRNSDLFIGIHGAGLTHLLFLPDWAVIFELYNCEDESCYLDLARLRGIKYITWEKKSKIYQQDEGHHPDGGAHAKFTNYRFDTKEFLRLVAKAEKHILNHKAYKKFVNENVFHDEL